MAAYIIATVLITDRERFAAYIKAGAGLSEQFGGEVVVKGKITDVVEGDVDPAEIVIITRYPDEAAARAYLGSDAYRANAAIRAGAGDVKTRLLVEQPK